MQIYPYKFRPLYVDRIWGGRNLERLLGRELPSGKSIGESWELADIPQGASPVANGPEAGKTIRQILAGSCVNVAGCSRLVKCGQGGEFSFPLLLKLLDANDTLSLQVHPDAEAAARIGGGAAMKTECWYVLESRGGFIYKGIKPGVTAERFRRAIDDNMVADLLNRYDVAAGDFYYLPAGTVHALGAGVVVAEVQTPSDTTYRVTDWGRGREIHVDLSMQCIHFDAADGRECDIRPRGGGKMALSREMLLKTDYFNIYRRRLMPGEIIHVAHGQCEAMMMLDGRLEIEHAGPAEPVVAAAKGDTLLLPAGLNRTTVRGCAESLWLEITLP